jgi:hypothetical protein
VLEAAQVDAEPAGEPPVLARREGTGFVLLAVTRPGEPAVEVEPLPVGARIDDLRRGEDPRGHREAPPVEARPDDAIEPDQPVGGEQAADEADREQHEAHPPKQGRRHAPALGRSRFPAPGHPILHERSARSPQRARHSMEPARAHSFRRNATAAACARAPESRE